MLSSPRSQAARGRRSRGIVRRALRIMAGAYYNPHLEALGGWCLLRSSKPLSGAGCGVGGGFDSHALPPFYLP
jgi:hypothetical protein